MVAAHQLRTQVAQLLRVIAPQISNAFANSGLAVGFAAASGWRQRLYGFYSFPFYDFTPSHGLDLLVLDWVASEGEPVPHQFHM